MILSVGISFWPCTVAGGAGPVTTNLHQHRKLALASVPHTITMRQYRLHTSFYSAVISLRCKDVLPPDGGIRNH